MPKTEYEKGYEDGFSDGFSLCQKIYSNAIDLLCKAFQKKEQKERKLISEQPQRRSERRGFRDIPIDGNLQVGDVIYTQGKYRAGYWHGQKRQASGSIFQMYAIRLRLSEPLRGAGTLPLVQFRR